MPAVTEEKIAMVRERVSHAVERARVYDVHTHLYDPAFGPLLLWGIDDLLVYHYLVAETFRYVRRPFEGFWKLSKTEQADLVWQELFIEHSPVSEACRGVVTTLHRLGIEPRQKDLRAIREWFKGWTVERYLDRCFELGGVRQVCMTNSPFDDVERPVWAKGFKRDPRFSAALRIDPLLLSWEESGRRLAEWGYAVGPHLTDGTLSEVRRFLADWTQVLKARYVMVSLPPQFQFPAKTDGAVLLEKAVLPHCREFGMPFSPMMGVKRAVNPS